MPTCSFCKKNYETPRGLTIFTFEGKSIFYCSSKCRRNADLKRDPKKVNWVKRDKTKKKVREIKEKVEKKENKKEEKAEIEEKVEVKKDENIEKKEEKKEESEEEDDEDK